MPFASHFLAAVPNGRANYQIFRGELAALGHRTEASVLYDDTIRSTALFGDNIHLSHMGTLLFSEELGASLKGIVR
jgi:hypothetical protein